MSTPSKRPGRAVAGFCVLAAGLCLPTAHAELRLSSQLGLPSGAPAPVVPAPTIELELAGSLRQSLIDRALDAGRAMVGTRYELGADRSDAVDCSALVRRMFVRAWDPLESTCRHASLSIL